MSTHSLISSILFYFMLGRFNKYNVMLNEKGKARGRTKHVFHAVRDLPLWSTHHQFLDLRAPRRQCRRDVFAKSA